MRLLGVDFGSARIGLAVGESELEIVSPRKPLPASGTLRKDAQQIHELAKKEAVDGVVVGIPVQEDAHDGGKMQRVCAKLGQELEALGLRVHYVDEALTSSEAEAVMMEAGLKASQRRHRRDGEAAARILERFFGGNHAQ